ncbi:hypothetical protein B5X24_HaOG211159 [Helicoverpa armigera]|nr:hypothetical protein B5X24_HaOG211159 [Helicoverpa armigera]
MSKANDTTFSHLKCESHKLPVTPISLGNEFVDPLQNISTLYTYIVGNLSEIYPTLSKFIHNETAILTWRVFSLYQRIKGPLFDPPSSAEDQCQQFELFKIKGV